MAVKTIVDPLKGAYDVLVATNNDAAGTVTSTTAGITSGVISASIGAAMFLVSGAVTTVKLPTIDASVVGKEVLLLTDTSVVSASASNPIGDPTQAFVSVMTAYTANNWMAVSGTLGYYWHSKI